MTVPHDHDTSISHERALEIALADPKARAAYELLEARERLINRIIAGRIAQGWSQADLARELGVSRPVVSRLESGDVDPRWSTIVRVFELLGVALSAEDGTRSDKLAG